MDDIAGKISELLSSPDGMERIKNLADSLFGSNAPQEQRADEPPVDGGGFSLPDGLDIGKLMGIATVLGNQKPDRRSQLLLALKPHLSQERCERVDKAVKFLKIAAILPLLKEQGILDIF